MMPINYQKYPDLLVPTIIQDHKTNKVLMLGFMNAAAFEKTKLENKVTFYSRSKNRLWTKGETSGNYLLVREIRMDCDADTILIKVRPLGPTCHTGTDTCFGESNRSFDLSILEDIIKERKNNPNEGSYTGALFAKGINKIAQKVGEEAVELVIEAKDNNINLFLEEAADLLFHYLVLLQAKNVDMHPVLKILEARHLSK